MLLLSTRMTPFLWPTFQYYQQGGLFYHNISTIRIDPLATRHARRQTDAHHYYHFYKPHPTPITPSITHSPPPGRKPNVSSWKIGLVSSS